MIHLQVACVYFGVVEKMLTSIGDMPQLAR